MNAPQLKEAATTRLGESSMNSHTACSLRVSSSGGKQSVPGQTEVCSAESRLVRGRMILTVSKGILRLCS